MKNVLVIDDNVAFGRMLQASIEDSIGDDVACSVAVFENGDEGIKHLAKERADLVITDLIMPGKEGLEIIMEIKKRFADVKVFAVSGGGPFDPSCSLEIAEKLGARGFAKPLSMGSFLTNVREALGL